MNTPHPFGSRRSEAFYGRRHGKTLRDKQAQNLNEIYASYGIDLTLDTPKDIKTLFSANVETITLEIGFGGGEHLLARARENPTIGFIGVEPFVNGMAKVTAQLAEQPLNNVRLYDDDASNLLKWLPDDQIDMIYLLYPDPWPKKKHWKRRFVNQSSLTQFSRVLTPDGKFRFASDIDTYVNWTLHHCAQSQKFGWDANSPLDWQTPYPQWPGTRYEAKAFREGRTPSYLTFTNKTN